LRAGGGTQRRERSARRNLSGLPASLSPHHHDNDGGDAWRSSARAWHWNRRGNAEAAWHHDCGRLDGQPIVDALHYTSRLSISGPLALMVRRAPPPVAAPHIHTCSLDCRRRVVPETVPETKCSFGRI